MRIKDIVGRGVYQKTKQQPLSGMNMSRSATKLVRGIRKRDIRPGTDAWFRAWFSLPYMTGEKPRK